MDEQMIVSGSRFFGRKFSDSSWRAGIAKNQLIFIIICSAALAVAGGTLAVVFLDDKSGAAAKWQCLSCDYEFTKKSPELPPIECPKCGGEAVRLTYRACPECKKPVLSSRSRLTKQGQSKRDALQDQPGGKIVGPELELPTEIQFWIKQNDGSYKWSGWIPATLGTVRVIQQYAASVQCPDCGISVSSRARRKKS